MAHLIETMARVADTTQSWHGLENTIPPDAPFDDWFAVSGLNYKVLRSKVRYATTRDADQTQEYCTMDSSHVLFRSDTLAPLAVVSSDYRVVQPRDILEFFREFAAKNQLTMDTAGVLAKGRRVWALARTGEAVTIGERDIIKQYVLLATSYDTTMATVAKHTSIRVVCNNTLTVAASNAEAAIRIPHSAVFDAKAVQLNLGLLTQDFAEFGQYANQMHRLTMTPTMAQQWYAELLLEKVPTEAEFRELQGNRVFRGLMRSWQSAPGAEATLWGAVNGATAFIDHVRGRGYDTRMNSAWFGAGEQLKRKAWAQAASIIDGIAAKAKDVVTL